ncbi:hypothetical protein Cpap_0504 [Ruminiclostridium papyrosolvens DSM 2782]|uniref:YmaF family protein n=1 Tax=Ruminiclostridium papyrosolvens DSM 2782 TaxID=588581 RepID=F1THK7_9FIRM|nr:YmaF family protein [Ruminiclostridium papyrosolvens]EGD46210.1 hypothetical protein Cpap_0504 [Ruminiclostridium papyrosolvens DSM 2782]WES35989.1 YmaF family protein [Ruminiclostridium papyrosolvens DSM 2782]
MVNHYHFYKFNSLTGEKHSHRLTGYTEYMFGIGLFHFHIYFGTTSFNGHYHVYSGITGLPIKTSRGHKHKIAGKLNVSDSHCHYYENYTHENIEYTGGKILKRVLS